jgi:hypothetical protein
MKVGNYRCDFYLPFAGIVVEYDEEFHKYQKEDDKNRMNEVLSIIDESIVEGKLRLYEQQELEPNEHLRGKSVTKVLRVEQGKEIDGLRRLMILIDETTKNSPVEYMA